MISLPKKHSRSTTYSSAFLNQRKYVAAEDHAFFMFRMSLQKMDPVRMVLPTRPILFSSWALWKFKSPKSLHCHYQKFLFQKPISSNVIQFFGCNISPTSNSWKSWAILRSGKKIIQNIITPLFSGKDTCPSPKNPPPKMAKPPSLDVWIAPGNSCPLEVLLRCQYSLFGRSGRNVVVNNGLMGWVSSVFFRHRCFCFDVFSGGNAKNKIMTDGKDRSFVIQKAFWSKDWNTDLYFTHL